MNLPQSPVTCKPLVAAALLILSAFAAPAMAQEEGGSEDAHETLFNCGTDAGHDRGFLSLEGIAQAPDTWTDLRFVRAADGDGMEIYRFEPAPDTAGASFLFSHSDGPEGYLVTVRWVDAGRTYVYYSLAIPPDPAVADDAGGGSAGLAISAHGQLVERVSCIERPYMFIAYLREAMSCDSDPPYGPAACGEAPYRRTVPLDPAKLGIVGPN